MDPITCCNRLTLCPAENVENLVIISTVTTALSAVLAFSAFIGPEGRAEIFDVANNAFNYVKRGYANFARINFGCDHNKPNPNKRQGKGVGRPIEESAQLREEQTKQELAEESEPSLQTLEK